MKQINIFILIFSLVLIAFIKLNAQQIVDSSYSPPAIPVLSIDLTDSKVMVDAGHNNLHTAEKGYYPFAKLLRNTGFNVFSSFNRQISRSALDSCDIFVIANALHESNVGYWIVPCPSAFSASEIDIINNWVGEGGKLMLIADHMPYAGAATELAKSFGFGFTNGFAIDTTAEHRSLFQVKDSTFLVRNLNKSAQELNIDSIYSFTGQAFDIPDNAFGILRLNDNHVNFLPDTAWRFEHKSEAQPAAGMYQMAYLNYGSGKVLVCGEAAMFTAQLVGDQKYPVGMNSHFAGNNHKLLLALFSWLSEDD